MKMLIIVVIIIIIGGLFFFILKNKAEGPVEMGIETIGKDLPNDTQGTFVFDTKESSIEWTGSKKIIKDYFDSGNINIKSGNVTFSEGLISGGEVILDMHSLTATSTGMGSGQDKLTSHLKSEDFFEVETYPEAKYTVISSVENEDGYTLNGELTLKDKTNPLNLEIKAGDENGNIILVGIAEIDRSLWGVKYGSESFFDNLGDGAINNIFTLEFKVVAKP